MGVTLSRVYLGLQPKSGPEFKFNDSTLRFVSFVWFETLELPPPPHSPATQLRIEASPLPWEGDQ